MFQYESFFMTRNDNSVSTDIYIGLNDAMVEDTYEWSSGHDFTYNNWLPGTSSSESNDCVTIQASGFKWEKTDCSTARLFVCKMDYIASKQISETNG